MLHVAPLMLSLFTASPVIPQAQVQRTPTEIVRNFLELQHADAVKLRVFLSEDVVWEGTGIVAPRVGPEAIAQMLGDADAMMPDARYEIISIAADGDRVFAETLTSGTVRSAPKNVPATVVGRAVSLRTVNVFEVKENRIHKVTAFFDILAYWRQLGIKG
ncbi:MAG: nuclear transport factor 2 family protein [Deltaproteobacteria bacterium]|nr:nuclear transport factor 2 family protein [Deltaproteobacteria bacterium]